MPKHWETSTRPLFVKTVFVNGNRHAILSGEDPLLRCGSSPHKKISRPNSSISFESDFSITSSESQDSNLENKAKPKVFAQRQQKDLSSELQSCLVGLKLASGNLNYKRNLNYKSKSNEDKCLCNSKERKKDQGQEKGNSKQRRHNHEKVCRRKQREENYDETKEVESERENDKKSCYIYNLENFKGKKKYCFVKISSQPPQFILNCCCEKTHPPNKNNLVISATIHNIIMTPKEDENIFHKSYDYVFPFQNAELYYNNHLTKSCYNSLSERVFQWLDLARKRKKHKENCNSTEESDSLNTTTERIFSRKTFVEEIKKTDINKPEIKVTKRPEKPLENETFEEVDGEVTGEPHVETLLSTDSSNDQQGPTNKQPTKPIETISELKNPSVPPLKIQDLLLNYHPKSRHGSQNKKRLKEPRNSSHRNRHKETDSSEEETWGKRTNRKGIFSDKPDTKQCQNRNLDELQDPIKSPILKEEFAERNQTSINNPNITRTRPVLIQNLLSPQQPDKMSYLQEKKIVWAAEKNTGRPQLHIFMPSIQLTDQSDDSMSECENYINL